MLLLFCRCRDQISPSAHTCIQPVQDAGQTVLHRSGRLCNRSFKCMAGDGDDPRLLPLASQFVINDPATVTGDRLMIVPLGWLGQIGWDAAQFRSKWASEHITILTKGQNVSRTICVCRFKRCSQVSLKKMSEKEGFKGLHGFNFLIGSGKVTLCHVACFGAYWKNILGADSLVRLLAADKDMICIRFTSTSIH